MSEQDFQEYRNMTQMLITAAEKALGEFLRKNDGDFKELVKLNLQKKTESFSDDNEDPIGSLYWQDLWDYAAKLEVDESKRTLFRKIKEKSECLNIIRARNHASHGNRPFKPYYWYSVAALVASPEFQALELKDVSEALWNAEKRTIGVIPPMDHIHNYRIETPNNLYRNEFEEVGFFGRNNEKRNIINQLTSGRYNNLVVSGPGGIGKTAVVQSALKEIALKDEFEFIFFYSFKDEWLTPDGVKKIENETLDDFYTSFEEFIASLPKSDYIKEKVSLSSYKDVKSCVFLDNVETPVVKNSAKFQALIDDIPSSWKVIATSRIDLDGFRTIDLRELDNKSCANLALAYTKHVVGDKGLKQFNQVAQDVVETSARNPLAIKLSIDLGKQNLDFKSSAMKAAKMVAGFSFKNLEEFLTPETIKILELIRQLGEVSSSEIGNVLELSSEEIFVSLKPILNTAMLREKVGQEGETTYLNSGLTNNFLLGSNVALSIREEIHSLVKRKNQLPSRASSFNKIAFYPNRDGHALALPDEVPEKAIKILRSISHVKPFFRLRYNQNLTNDENAQLTDGFNKWRLLNKSFRENNSYYFLIEGRFKEFLRDASATDSYMSAIKCDPKSKNARYVLANYYFNRSEYEQAANTYEEALDSCEDYFQFRTGLLISLQFTNKEDLLDKARQLVSDWSNNEVLRPKLIEYEVQITKRQIEVTGEGRVTYINNLIDKLNEGFTASLIKHITDFLDSLLVSMLRQRNYAWVNEISKDGLSALIETFYVLGGNLSKTCRRLEFTSDGQMLQELNEVFQVECDVDLINIELDKISESAVTELSDIETREDFSEFRECTISYIPNPQDPTYCFAVDSETQETVFVPYGVFREEFPGATGLLDNDSKLLVKYEDQGKRNPGATEAFLIAI